MRPLAILAAVVLAGCAAPAMDATPPSASTAATSPAPRATRTVTHRPTATHTTRAPASPARVVYPGAYCTPEGATGRTTAGTLMRCTRKAGETRARWRRG